MEMELNGMIVLEYPLVTLLMTTVGHVILFLLTTVFKLVLEFGVEQVL